MATNSTTDADDTSVATFTSALIFNAAIGLATFLLFCILRPIDRATYEPRISYRSEDKTPPPLSRGLFAWVWPTLRAPDLLIIERTSLDCYMFLNFLRTTLKLFFVFAVVACAILLPLNAVGGGGNKGLQSLSIGNIKGGSNYLWAHLILTVLFVAAVLYTILHSAQGYINLRHRYLLNPAHQASAQANTILVTDIPRSLNSRSKLQRIFSAFPGGVRQIYMPRKVSQLEDHVEERDKVAIKLEKVLSKYTVQCSKLAHKHTKTTTGQAPPEHLEQGGAAAAIDPPTRPTHRLGYIPFVGDKVDSVAHYSHELRGLGDKIASEQSTVRQRPRLGSAFVLFNRQIAAHMAYQSLLDKSPLHMNPRHLEVNPDDVVWSNLSMNPYMRQVRSLISVAITIVLVLFWAVPVSLVTSISSLSTLASIDAFKGLNDLPPVVFGVIQGILPALAVAILMMILPMVLRLLSRFEGTVLKSDVELSLVHRYFFFLVVNVFLVSTLAGGITSAIGAILDNPQQIAYILAQELPKVNVFFLSYIMLQGLSGASKDILRVVPLIMRNLKATLLAGTPRELLKVNKPSEFHWGTAIPSHTLIFVVGMVYSTIAPLVLIFIVVYFSLYYLVYRYQMLYIYDETSFDTGGLSFPRILYHMLVGVYLFVLTFLGLMALNKSPAKIVISVLLLAVVIAFNVYLIKIYDPLFKVLPINSYQETCDKEEVCHLLSGDRDEGTDLSPGTIKGKLADARAHADDQSAKVNFASQSDTLRNPSNPHLTGAPSGPAAAAGYLPRRPSESSSDGSLPDEDPHSHSAAGLTTQPDPAKPRLSFFSAYDETVIQATPGSAASCRPRLDDNDLRLLYTNPAVRASTTSVAWIPSDNTHLASPLFEEVQRESGDRVVVVTDHAYLDGKSHIKVDTQEPPSPGNLFSNQAVL
ncbi:phosphate metabolism protein 7 [Tieghemiomyces parasiticus]|uniref:Phosphate metabolism protein 7 n=1 Tax=Tieghemiomyces parasiticus TaxID=78921 RepID=A0A9W7ZR84_9FUNG|nr:phosphate metabolism protein 7 [Tieghemiomyces parasiticus]